LPDYTIVFVRIPLAPTYCHEDFYEPFIKYYLEQGLNKFPAERTCFLGSASGCCLAAVLVQQLQRRGKKIPKDTILLSPLLDSSLTFPHTDDYEKTDPILHPNAMLTSFKWWARGVDLTDPLMSPLYGDWSNMGRVMIATGKLELLYPAAKSLEEKVDKFMTHNTFHDYFALGFLPEAKEVRKEILRRLSE
jgi:acetyl esterase/lipase